MAKARALLYNSIAVRATHYLCGESGGPSGVWPCSEILDLSALQVLQERDVFGRLCAMMVGKLVWWVVVAEAPVVVVLLPFWPEVGLV